MKSAEGPARTVDRAATGAASPDGAVERAWTLMQRFVESHNRHGELAEALGFRLGAGRGKVLFRLRDGPMTLTELARVNGVDAPYTTLVVDKLEAHGLVQRRAHPDDRRRKLVALTAAGRGAIATADAILLRPPGAFTTLTAEELRQLTMLLERLTPAGTGGLYPPPLPRGDTMTPTDPEIDATSTRITDSIEALGDWRGETLAHLRELIHAADPDVEEEWKWQKPSSPGVPVWSHDGGICTGETYKQVVKLTFHRGASLDDPAKLFNSSLEGKVRRAIDVREGEQIDEEAFKDLIRVAVAANAAVLAQRSAKKR